MNRIDEATILVRECESRIRALMESALAARQYDQIGRLASLAAAIANIVEGEVAAGSANLESAALSSAVARDQTSAYGAGVAAPETSRAARRKRSDEYPRFERHGDRLIKLGWSKKERSVYEHRASFDVVKAVTAKLAASVGKGGYLRMDEVLPVVLPDGTEVPSYQAYLVLAWLRDRGTVQRQGNDGYKLVRQHLNADDTAELWAQTSERE